MLFRSSRVRDTVMEGMIPTGVTKLEMRVYLTVASDSPLWRENADRLNESARTDLSKLMVSRPALRSILNVCTEGGRIPLITLVACKALVVGIPTSGLRFLSRAAPCATARNVSAGEVAVSVASMIRSRVAKLKSIWMIAEFSVIGPAVEKLKNRVGLDWSF